MYLRDLLASLARLWSLALLALFLAVGVGWFTWQAVPASYQMSASVLLLPPKSPDDPGANRYLALSELGQAVSVVIRSMDSDAANAVIDASEDEGEYFATTDPTSSAPVVVIMTEGKSPEVTRNLVDASLAHLPIVLTQLQRRLEIKPSARITSLELARDLEPTVENPARIRIVAAVSVLTLALLAVLIGMIDGALLRRQRKPVSEKPANRRTGGKAPDPPNEVRKSELASSAREPRPPGEPPPRRSPGESTRAKAKARLEERAFR